MRTFILVCIVALLVACGVAYAVDLVTVAVDHPEGKCVVTLTINTAMLHHGTSITHSASGNDTTDDRFLDVKGKITTVRPENREIVLTENLKTWTFQLAKDGKVFINDREVQLSDLHAGDDAIVTFDHEGQQLLASIIRCTRH
jgi:hypothetical protein